MSAKFSRTIALSLVIIPGLICLMGCVWLTILIGQDMQANNQTLAQYTRGFRRMKRIYSTLSYYMLCFIIISVVLFTLFACIPLQDTGPFQMYLTKNSVERLFKDGAAFVENEKGQQSLSLYCHINEGSWCYFGSAGKIEAYTGLYDTDIENEAHQVEKDFARQITTELNPKYIEHSKHNGVKVHCTKTPYQVVCQVNRGGGWQPLTIKR